MTKGQTNRAIASINEVESRMRGNFHVRFGKGVMPSLWDCITLVHYNPSVLEAFNSVEHIMRDVNYG